MLRYVTIIFLILFSTLALAAKKSKCERVLVSEAVQDHVHELALEVAELAGELKLKMDLRSAPSSQLDFAASDRQVLQYSKWLTDMTTQIAAIRQNFTTNPSEVDQQIQALENQLHTVKPIIQTGLLVTTARPTFDNTPRPKGFMKREIFTNGGPFEDMADWSAQEIQDDLAAHTPPPTVQNADVPTPWPDRLGWPPREKP